MTHPNRRARLNVFLRNGRLDERIVPAVFNIADGDIAGLVAAITTANTNTEADTINLAVSGTYNFTAVADPANGGIALPAIALDTSSANSITIVGNGSTFSRSGSTAFRFLSVDDATDPAVLNVSGLTFVNGLVDTSIGGAVLLNGGNATFTDCIFQNNTATDGGAIGCFTAGTNRTLVLTNCSITGNSATTGVGGGVATQGGTAVSFTDCVVSNNVGDGTGGVWCQGNNLTFLRTNVTNNFATNGLAAGGGIFVQGDISFTDGDLSGNVAGGGAGLFIQGNATFTNASITNNNATFDTASGGGIFIQGDLTLVNVTVSGNRGSNGGGIALQPGSTKASIQNSTIVDNSAYFGLASGGGILVTSGCTLTIANTIVAGNFFEPTVTNGTGLNIDGTVVSQGFNFFGTNDFTINGSTTGNIVGTVANPIDPQLNVLGNYGGNSLTRPLLPGSPCLDAGDPAFVPPPDTDQRGSGFPRLIGRLDIGALEAAQFNLSVTKDDGGLTTVVPGQGIVYTITVTNIGPGAANGANVQDILNAQFSNAVWSAVFSGGASGNSSGTGSINEIVDLPVGGVIIYTLAATISPDATGLLSNTATILPPNGGSDPNGGDNTATDINTLTPVADVGVVKFTAGGSATPGQPIRYTIIVSNDGPSTAAGVSLTDILPAALLNANWTSFATGGATGNNAFGTGNILETVTLPPGSDITYQIDAIVSPDASAGQLVNTVTADLPLTISDPVPDNNTATDKTTVIVGKQVVVAAPDAGQLPFVKLFNPLSGSLRMTIQAYGIGFRGGVRVATADFNGDGTQDIVVAPGPGGGPHIRVFDGLDGTVLQEFFAYDAGFRGGVYVAAADVTGDGVPDIITGAGAGGGPHVRVFNGADPGRVVAGPIGDFFAYAASFTGGVRVAAADTNKDGLADIITGAGPGGGPHVIVWNAANRQARLSFFAYGADFRGGVYVAAADMNFDGFADVITGAGEGGGPLVRYFDGRNALRFREFYAFPQTTGGLGSNALWSSGVRVSTFSDITGDSLAELAVAPGSGRAPTVRFINGALTSTIREITAFDPSFLGGVFVGGA
ncbi:MAG: DUF11 domain-containing protein [Gemmataceae bacterium]|nr:DUF11 domain-containing protein [Gemmataceae bacterium]